MSTTGAGALEQALACTAAPGLLAGARANRLPEDALVLLRLAGGDQQCLVQHAKQLSVPARKLHEAAIFYIQQVLFAPGANSYRVLGVNPEALDGRLREHYRWLVRWLHPDRNSNEWEDVYLDRVHRAWQQVRSPERRRVHDLTCAHSAFQPTIENLATRPPRVRKSRQRTVVRRALPWPLLATATAGLLFAVVSLSWNKDSGAEDESAQVQTPAVAANIAIPLPLAARQVLLPNRVAPADNALAAPAAFVAAPRHETDPASAGVSPRLEENRASPARVTRLDVHPVMRPMVVARPVATVDSAQAVALTLAADPRPLRAPPPAANVAPAVLSPVTDPQAPVRVAERASRLPGAFTPLTAAPVLINDRVAFNLVQKFRRAFNEADLLQLMSLFARDAQLAGGGDRQAIAETFGRQFRSPQRRVISFGRPEWSATAQGVVVVAAFKGISAPRASTDRQAANGRVRFELRHEDGLLRIYQIQHDEF